MRDFLQVGCLLESLQTTVDESLSCRSGVPISGVRSSRAQAPIGCTGFLGGLVVGRREINSRVSIRNGQCSGEQSVNSTGPFCTLRTRDYNTWVHPAPPLGALMAHPLDMVKLTLRDVKRNSHTKNPTTQWTAKLILPASLTLRLRLTCCVRSPS